MILFGAIYLTLSIAIGFVITSISWQRSGKSEIIAFIGCALCFALVWPCIVLSMLAHR